MAILPAIAQGKALLELTERFGAEDEAPAQAHQDPQQLRAKTIRKYIYYATVGIIFLYLIVGMVAQIVMPSSKQQIDMMKAEMLPVLYKLAELNSMSTMTPVIVSNETIH
jgi:hypothetical protein